MPASITLFAPLHTSSIGVLQRRIESTQYASRRYRERLTATLLGSMSRARNPYDNAHAESFMKTLKHEDINPRGYCTMADVSAHLPLFLEHIYNNNWQRSALNYRSPNAFEAEHALTLFSGQFSAR